MTAENDKNPLETGEQSKPAAKYEPPMGYNGSSSVPPWVGTGNYVTPTNYSGTAEWQESAPSLPYQDPNQAELYRRAESRVKAKLSFYRHLTSYVLVNILLWSIALITWLGSHGSVWSVIWPVWVTVFWGIGLVSDYIKTFGFNENTRQRMIDEEIRRLRH